MPLPNTGMSFTPFDPLPASQLNDLVENIEALADGSGLDAGAITPDLRSGGFATGALTVSSGGGKTVSGLSFQPKFLRLSGVVTSNNSISAQSSATFDGTTLRCMATSGSGAAGFSRYYTSFNVINVDPAPVITLNTFVLTSDGFTYSVVNSSADVTAWYEAYA